MQASSIRQYLTTDQGKRNSMLFLFMLIGLVCLMLTVNMPFSDPAMLGIQKPLGDYANYYYGSKFALAQVSIKEIYDPFSFNQLIRAEGEQNVFANYAPVPPFSLVFYIPFVFFTATCSKFLFGLLGLCLAALSLYRLLKRYPIAHYGVLLLPLVLLFPLKSNLYLGQSYLYILCFLIEGFIFSNREKGTLISALFFSLAIALKIFPAIVLIYLLFTGKRKILGYTIAFTALWFAASLPFMGSEELLSYLTQSLPRLFNGEINDPYSSSYQSVTVLLRKLFVPDALLNPHALFNSSTLFIVLNVSFSALVLSFCVAFLRSSSADQLFKFSFTLFCGLLISGYGTSYTLLLLVFPFIALMRTDIRFNRQLCLYTVLFLFISAVPIYWFYGQVLALQFIRLYALLILLIVLIRTFQLPFSRAVFLPLLFLLALPLALKFFNKEDASTYYVSTIPSLLSYSYHQTSQGISIGYYDNKGNQQIIHATTDTLSSSKDLETRKGHIYYKGQALTHGNNNNKSPMLLNNKSVIYLSDKNRGIGLYTLRKINIPE